MKKTFILLAAMLVTSIAAKAWEVGDYYDADGIPSIIVYVDESGEHGLRMGPRYFYTAERYKEALEQEEQRQNTEANWVNSKFAQKQVNKQLDKHMETILANSPEGVNKEEVMRKIKMAQTPGGTETMLQQEQEKLLAMQNNASPEDAELIKQGIAATEYDPYMAYKNALTFVDMQEYRFTDFSNRKLKVMKQNFKDLAATNTGSGYENTTNVIDYCRANNIDAELYFPEYVYARSLGDNWFIPGNDELELIAKSVLGGVGEEYKVSIVEKIQKTETANKTTWNSAKFFFPYVELMSSSMINGSWNGKGIGKMPIATVRQDYYSLFMTNDYLGQNYWYIFAKNYQTVICVPVCKF